MQEFLKIDADKLRKELAKRQLTAAQASRNMGYEAGYLSNVFVRGHITPPTKLLMQKMLNISYDSIKPEEVKKEEQNVKDSSNDLQEIKKLLNDLILSVHRVGNLEIQILEKLSEVKNN